MRKRSVSEYNNSSSSSSDFAHSLVKTKRSFPSVNSRCSGRNHSSSNNNNTNHELKPENDNLSQRTTTGDSANSSSEQVVNNNNNNNDGSDQDSRTLSQYYSTVAATDSSNLPNPQFLPAISFSQDPNLMACHNPMAWGGGAVGPVYSHHPLDGSNLWAKKELDLPMALRHLNALRESASKYTPDNFMAAVMSAAALLPPPEGRVVGVYYDKQRRIWRANWREGGVGKRKTKNFSVDDYGFDEARRLAIQYRILKMNQISDEKAAISANTSWNKSKGVGGGGANGANAASSSTISGGPFPHSALGLMQQGPMAYGCYYYNQPPGLFFSQMPMSSSAMNLRHRTEDDFDSSVSDNDSVANRPMNMSEDEILSDLIYNGSVAATSLVKGQPVRCASGESAENPGAYQLFGVPVISDVQVLLSGSSTSDLSGSCSSTLTTSTTLFNPANHHHSTTMETVDTTASSCFGVPASGSGKLITCINAIRAMRRRCGIPVREDPTESESDDASDGGYERDTESVLATESRDHVKASSLPESGTRRVGVVAATTH